MAMKGFTMEHTIPAPPSAVFAVLADLDQATQWMPDIQKIERLTEGKLGAGSKWIETRNTRRGPFVSTIEVTDFEPGSSFGIRAENRKAQLTFRFTLTPDGSGTKVTSASAGRLKGLMAPFSGMLVKDMKQADTDILARLEAQVAKNASKATSKASKAKAAAKSPKTATPKATKAKKASKKAK